MLLKRFAYPCRFADIVAGLGRPVPQLCMVTNQMMDYVFDGRRHDSGMLVDTGLLRELSQ